MAVLRIIVSEPLSAAMNLAIGEAIFEARCHHAVDYDTLRIFYHSRPAVILGKHESIDDIDLEYCLRHRFEVTMRMTGGGCVMFAPDDVHYEYVGQHKGLRNYRAVNKYVLAALKSLRLPKPCIDPQDETSIKVNGRKISGNAQAFAASRKVLLHHGSILSVVNASQMLCALRPTREQQSLATAENIENTVCGYMQLKQKLTPGDVQKALIEAFTSGKKESQDYFFGSLTRHEKGRAQALLVQQYANFAWQSKRNTKRFGICYLYNGPACRRNYERV